MFEVSLKCHRKKKQCLCVVVCGSMYINSAVLLTHPGAQMCFTFLPVLRRHFVPSAVELLPYVRGTLKMQAREAVCPIKTC